MENQKNQVEVVINGKVYKLSGVESEEYIQSVAKYIDKKLTEIYKTASCNTVNSNAFPVLIAINIADDLFKEREEKQKIQKELIEIKEKFLQYEKELSYLNEENIALKDKLQIQTVEYSNAKKELDNVKIECSKVQKELSDYIETFDEIKNN